MAKSINKEDDDDDVGGDDDDLQTSPHPLKAQTH